MTIAYPAEFVCDTMREVSPQDESLGAMFAAVVERHGRRTAVTYGSESVTYSGLDRAANHVAAELVKQGAGPGSIVAICVERSIEMVAAMLGVAKSGAAYLPLDAGYPAARLTETIADARPVVVLTTRDLSEHLHGFTGPTLFVEELCRMGRETAPEVDIHQQDAAYVIYTSGSTGRPKGVVVSNQNVIRLLSETERWFHFNSQDVWTMFHSFAFDFSVWEMWGCLLNGGRLVVVPFAVSRSPEEFHALLVREQVTVLNQTPSAFALLDQVDARLPVARLSLRVVIFGGETLRLASLRDWMDRHGDGDPQMVNMYGITEATVHVTYRRILKADTRGERESLIGEPIGDMEVYLLDDQMRPVADGTEGELCIGGAGVAIGYLNRPGLTTQRFFAKPFGPAGSKLYRSGDLARRREDGELVYLGRRDCQVKINGFRIELGEIEAALLMHPGVVQACVKAHAEPGGDPRLVAYFVAEAGKEPGTRELSEFLATQLPAHMMPAFYQRLAVFPLTSHGKVERQSLPFPYAGSRLQEHRMLHGASPLEDRIASIWRRVLKTTEVGLDDNFFDVGGSSLLLIAVRTGLQEQLDRQIPVAWMFECTTIRELGKKLAEPFLEMPHSAFAMGDNARCG